MTEVSTPACSSVMAQLCLRTCGWICLPSRDGHSCVAVTAWVLTRRATASRLSRRPVRGGEQRVARAAGGVRPARHSAGTRLGLVERDRSLLSALAFAEDAGACAEGDVTAIQADEFGDTQAGLDGK